MKKRAIILFIATLFLLASCTNDINNPERIFKGESWAEIFEEFWTVMDEEYVHFSYEETDWDGVYKEYATKFKDLDYSDADDCFTAFGYFNHILLNLSDYHYRLIIETNSGYTYDARPSFLRKWAGVDGDVDELPDIRTGADSKNLAYYSVKGGSKNPISSTLRTENYINKAVDGYSEIDELKKNSVFHNSSEIPFIDTGTAEFPESTDSSMYYKFVIAPFELDETKWFVGVTESGVLYIYFSKFVKPGTLAYFYNMYNYEDLTPEEQKAFRQKYSTERMAYEHLSSATDDKSKNEFAILAAMGKYATYLNDAVSIGKVSIKNSSTSEVEEKEIKGVVIDLRNNGGGYAAFFQEFMGLFFASDKTVGYTQTKIGYSRYDIGPWVEYRLGTYNSSLKEDYKKRVAVITNGFSVSCSELTTITSKLLPNSKRFGSTTFGGTCALAAREIYHSGPYTHGSLTVRTTSVRFKASDGISYESLGITPDISIPLNTTNDDRFIAAVKWVETGSVT